jgi:hypothetical protein
VSTTSYAQRRPRADEHGIAEGVPRRHRGEPHLRPIDTTAVLLPAWLSQRAQGAMLDHHTLLSRCVRGLAPLLSRLGATTSSSNSGSPARPQPSSSRTFGGCHGWWTSPAEGCLPPAEPTTTTTCTWAARCCRSPANSVKWGIFDKSTPSRRPRDLARLSGARSRGPGRCAASIAS